MNKRIGCGAALALWLGASAMVAQAATPPCVTEAEGEAFMITLMPDIIDAVGKTCAASLPAGATLRAGLPAMVARYRADAPAAWPLAKNVFGKIAGESMQGVDPELLRPLIGALAAPMIAKDIKPADCPRIDRVASLLAPLPPRNTASLIVLLFSLGTKDKPGKAPFTICPAPDPSRP